MLENSELYDEADEGIRTFTDLTENVFIKDILSKMNNEGDFFIPQ